MKSSTWKKRIEEACKEAGTYRPHFEYVIGTLADILEKRDECRKLYEDSGEGPVVSYTNKAGATNKSKNATLVMWIDLNTSALAYWRDLGLTPAGLRKIDEGLLKKQKKNALAEALADLERNS